jgi:hypothetical protein
VGDGLDAAANEQHGHWRDGGKLHGVVTCPARQMAQRDAVRFDRLCERGLELRVAGGSVGSEEIGDVDLHAAAPGNVGKARANRRDCGATHGVVGGAHRS